MNLFLPFANPTECAICLDSLRLNSQYLESIIILKSLAKVYEKRPKGDIGFSMRPCAQLVRGHELFLARHIQALAQETFKRPLPVSDPIDALESRKRKIEYSTALVEFLEDIDWPDTKPNLIGDEEFHSGFRSWLLYKDLERTTFQNWSRKLYPDHISTRNLPLNKSPWRRDDYKCIWEHFGQPEYTWYGQFNWTETADDLKMFYLEDRIPQLQKELTLRQTKTSPKIRSKK